MAQKFIGLRPDSLPKFDFTEAKWAKTGDGRSYKLVSPDLDKDRCFASAEFKVMKKYDPEGRLYISGIANANVVDRMQERLDPRGIEVEPYMRNAQLLAHHSYYHPIGQVEQLDIQEDGVHFSGWIGDPSKGAELTPMQKEIRSLVAQGVLKTVSVGFIPKKVRAPLYGENGVLQEPAVIESWELLELSVVAVPANQDSVFEMRGYKTGEDSGTVKPEENQLVQSLIFDNAVFTEESAKTFAQQSGEVVSVAKECDDHIRVDVKTTGSVVITTGVQLMSTVAKPTAPKTKDSAAAAEDNSGENYQQEMLTLMRGMNELVKKNYDICELMMKKMDEKPSEDEGGEKPEPPATEEEKGLTARLDKLEKGFDKLVQSFNLVVEKLAK
jgi:HK97 family phage prohead protease